MQPSNRHVAPAPAARVPTALVPAALTAAVLSALSLALLLLVVTRWGPLEGTDRDIAVALHRSAMAHHGWTETNRVLTDWVWDPWAMRAALAVVTVWLLWRREWLLAAWVVGTGAAGTALQQGVKAAVDRERPHWHTPVDSAHYAAFPSGHALTATVTFGLLLWLMALHRARARWLWTVTAVAVVSVLGVGFTRLYLGVHWASDVVGGWLLGAALVCGSAAAYAYVRDHHVRVREDERNTPPDGRVRS